MAVNWKMAKAVTKPVKAPVVKKERTAKNTLLANLDKQIAMAKASKTPTKKNWWSLSEDSKMAVFTLKYQTTYLSLGEENVVVDGKEEQRPIIRREWPVKDIVAIYESLKKSVAADEFADQLAALEIAAKARTDKASATRAANKAK